MLRPALLFCASCLSVAAATLHVNVKGDGQGDGSAAKPFRTIQEAAEQAQPGDTVLVAPGIYRERIAPPRGGKEGAPIVFRSSEKHGAVVRGSTPWKPTWQKVAPGIYSGPVDESLFADTSHVDGGNPFRIPSSSTPYGREGQPEAERKYPNSDPKLSFNLGQVFVDDEEAEIGVFDVFGEDAVGADDDVDFAEFQVFEHLFRFGSRAEAAEHFDAHGEAGEAAFEGFDVLEAEVGGGG